MNSEKFSSGPSRALPNWILASFLFVSFAGFADATYLAVKHYTGTPLNCSIFEGCEKVTTSPYATLLGVPLGLFGAVYYLAILLASIAYLDTGREKIIFYTAYSTIVGLLASAWFVYLQLFVIKAICPYCMASAGTSMILFALGMLVLRHHRTRSGDSR